MNGEGVGAPTPTGLRARRRLVGLAVLAGLFTLLGLGLAAGFLAGRAQGAPTCTKSWAAPVSGLWSDPTMWSPSGVPASTDNVCVTVAGGYTVTVQNAVSAASLQVGTATGSAVEGVTLDAEGCGGGFNTTLALGSELDVYNQGRIDLDSSVCGGNTDTLTIGTTATIDGTLSSDPGVGGTRTIAGSVVNKGTVAIDTPTSYSTSGATFTNDATVSVADSSEFVFSNSSTFVSAGGSITDAGSGQLQMTAGSTFQQGGGTVAGPNPVLVDSSTLSFTGSGAPAAFVMQRSDDLTGNIAAGQSVTLNAEGCGDGFNTSLTAASGFTNAGTIDLSSTVCGGNNSTLTVSAGVLTNTGVIESDPGVGGTRILQASVLNQGSLVVNETLDVPSATTITNEGSVSVAASQTFGLSNSGTFVNQSGTVASVAPGQLQVASGSTFVEAAGKVTGSPVLVDSSTLSLTGSGSPAAFVVQRDVAISGDVAAGQSVTLNAEGCGNGFNTTLTASSGFSNAGTIDLTSTVCGGNNSTMTVGSGVLTNTGVLEADPGVGGTRVFDGALDNQGSLIVNESLTDPSSGTVTNQGSTSIAASQVLAIDSGGKFVNQAGTVASVAPGQLQVTSGSTFDEIGGTVTGSPVLVDSSTVDFDGTGAPAAVVTQRSVTVLGNIASGQSLTMNAEGCGDGFNTTVTAASGFTNAGTIDLTSTVCGGNNDTLTISAGTLTNDGVIQSDPGVGGARAVLGSVDNKGSMVVNESVTDSTSGTVDNQGSVAIADGEVFGIDGGGEWLNSTGTVVGTGAGQVQITSGSTFVEGAGTVTGSPVLVDSSTLDISGAGAPAAFLVQRASQFEGNVASGQSVTLNAEGCGDGFNTTLTAAASFANAGTIVLSSTVCGGNGSTLALTSGTLSNSGVIESEAGVGGVRAISGNLDNTSGGTLAISTPTSIAGFAATNSGSVLLTQPLTLTGATFTSAAGTIASTGSGQVEALSGSTFVEGGGTTSGSPIVVDSSTLDVTGTGAPAAFTVDRADTLAGNVAAGQTITINAEGCGSGFNSTLTDADGFTNAGSITLTSSVCGGNTSTLAVTSGTLTNTGTITSDPGVGGGRDLDATLVEDHGTIDLLAAAPLTIDASLVVAPDGRLQVAIAGAGDTGTATVSGATTFEGTIEADTSFVPTLGESFPIASYPSETGAFSATDFGSAPYTPVYGATVFSLTALEPGGATLSTSAAATVAGQAFMLTATVVAVPPATGTPTGQVTFLDGATSLGVVALDGSGSASLSVSNLAVGTHSLSAVYSGDSKFGATTTSAISHVVSLGDSAVALSSSANPSTGGQSVTFSAVVSAVSPSTVVPSGSVAFRDGSTVLGTEPLDGSGTATFSTAALAPGPHDVVAVYSGSSFSATSLSSPVDQVVTAVIGDTAVALTVTPDKLVATQPAELDAQVASILPASLIPTGMVTFSADGNQIGSVSVDAGGAASLAVPAGFGAGAHSITASYGGDPTFNASVSLAAAPTVAPASVTIDLSGTAVPGVQDEVQFVVGVHPVAPAAGMPVGSAVMDDGDVALGDVSLSQGAGTFVSCFATECGPVTTTTSPGTTSPGTTTEPASTTTEPSSTTTETTTTQPSGSTSTTSGSVPTSVSGQTTIPPQTSIRPQTSIPPQTSIRPQAIIPPQTTASLSGWDRAGQAQVALAGGSRSGGRAGLRPDTDGTHDIVADYGGDGNFEPLASTPLVVTVDGSTVTIGPSGTTTTLPGTTTTVVATTVSTPTSSGGGGTTSPPTSPGSPTTGGGSTSPTSPGGSGTGGSGTGGSGQGGSGTGGSGTGGSGTGSSGTGGGGTAVLGTTATNGSNTVKLSTKGGNRKSRGGSNQQASGPIGGRPAGQRTSQIPEAPAARLLRRSEFAGSVATPRDVSTNPLRIAENLALAALLVLLIAFPAHIFNYTLGENYDEVLGWFGATRKRLDKVRSTVGRVPTPVVLISLSTVGALLYGLLDPNFGFNLSSFALLLGLMLAMVATSLVYDLPRGWYLRRKLKVKTKLRGYPAGVVVAVLLVALSRAAHFNPGYLFGVFTGVQSSERIDERIDGRALAEASLALFAVATLAWFLWLPVSSAAVKPAPGFVVLVLDALLSTLWVAGVQGVIFGLMPLRFLDGDKVWRWSHRAWIALYLMGMFAFVHTMLRPGPAVPGHHESILDPLILFMAFGVFSIAFWAYFRYRPERPDRASPEELADELV